MADDLTFPRIVYRGLPDTLGRGPHTHPETDELVGETKRCNSQDELDADLKAGWRLTREIPEVAKEIPEVAKDESAAKDAPPKKEKK